jgi:hypothetical protein
LRRLSNIYETYNFCIVKPKYFGQAIRVEVWRNIMKDEINMIVKNKTWEVVKNRKRMIWLG